MLRAPEVVLDVNTLDAGSGYLDLGLSIVSPDEHVLAYAVDTSGNEVFTLRFRDLRTGADLPDVVEGVGYTGAWTSDSSGFLYTVPDASWRHERIRAHRLGDDAAADVDVLVEPDRRYEVSLRRCRSEQAIVVLSECRDTTEAWYVDPTGADLVPRSLGGRRTGVMYRAEHVRDGDFLRSPTTTRSSSGWRPVRSPVPAGRTTRPGVRSGPRTRPSGSSGSTRSPGTWWRRCVAAATACCACWPPTTWPEPGTDVTSRFVGGEIRLARNTWYDAATVSVPTSPTPSRSCTRRSPWPTAR